MMHITNTHNMQHIIVCVWLTIFAYPTHKHINAAVQHFRLQHNMHRSYASIVFVCVISLMAASRTNERRYLHFHATHLGWSMENIHLLFIYIFSPTFRLVCECVCELCCSASTVCASLHSTLFGMCVFVLLHWGTHFMIIICYTSALLDAILYEE